MSWYDPEEPLLSFEITAQIDFLTKAERKKLFKQIDYETDDEDTQAFEFSFKGNKVITISGVVNERTLDDLRCLFDKWQVEYECYSDIASDFYNKPDGGMGWRDTSWD